jgi:hypothetical protein
MDSRRLSCRFWFAVPALAAASAAASAQSGHAAVGGDPCAALSGEPAAIERVSQLGDITLADGRLGRLADLDLGIDAMAAGRWAEHLGAVRGAILGLQVRAEKTPVAPDRWGRLALRLSPTEAATPPLHRKLVASGLARVWPQGEDDACASSLLAIEAEARDRGLGLWREPGARIFVSDEPQAILAMTGRFAIIQGQVLTVRQRPRRIYLNFGRDFQRDFTATLAPRTVRLLEKAGITPSSLRGKTVRVRGMVGGRRAPAVEIISAGQIEVVR